MRSRPWGSHPSKLAKPKLHTSHIVMQTNLLLLQLSLYEIDHCTALGSCSIRHITPTSFLIQLPLCTQVVPSLADEKLFLLIPETPAGMTIIPNPPMQLNLSIGPTTSTPAMPVLCTLTNIPSNMQDNNHGALAIQADSQTRPLAPKTSPPTNHHTESSHRRLQWT